MNHALTENQPFALDGPLFYTISDLMAILGIGRSTLHDWIEAGRFPAPVKISPKTIRFRADDLRAWLAAREAA
ncbi:prophage regulatory protein [Burkholderia multivorans]